MTDWSDDESDFTEQIALMAIMGIQRVVQILEESEEEEDVVNSQPRTRQPIPRDREEVDKNVFKEEREIRDVVEIEKCSINGE
ncbi:hypothetical protein LXL04_016120 [Taraxacum kok-saghyz]